MKDIPILGSSGKTLPEAYENALKSLKSLGIEFKTQYDKEGDLPSIDCTANITILEPDTEPMIHKAFPGGIDDLKEYTMELMGYKNHWCKCMNDKEDTKWEYCVCPDTLILTKNYEEKRITDVCINEEVFCFDYDLNKLVISKIKDKVTSQGEVHKFSFIDSDKKLEVSSVHPLYVSGRGWVKAKDIMIGDFVQCVYNEREIKNIFSTIEFDEIIIDENSIDLLPFKVNKEKVKKELKEKGLLPFNIKSENSWKIILLCGYLFGDGWLNKPSNDGRKSDRLRTSFSGEYGGLIKISNLLASMGFFPQKILTNNQKGILNGRKIEGTSLSVTLENSSLYSLFYLLGCPIGFKSNMDYNIPNWILESKENEVKRIFLSGFCDAEICVPSIQKDRRGIGTHIYFRQNKDKNKLQSLQNLITDIKTLFNSLNIKTNILTLLSSSNNKSYSLGLGIGDRNEVEKFFEIIKIPFSDSKTLRIKFYQKYYEYCLQYMKENNLQNLSNQKCLTIGEKLGEGIKENLFFIEIENIEKIGNMELYDIAIENKHHNFVGNGIVCHNTYNQRLTDWGTWFESNKLLGKHKRSKDLGNQGINQIENIVNKLAKQPFTRQAQAITWMPFMDNDVADPPCLQSLWYRLLEEDDTYYLNCNVRFRSNDAWGAFFMNAFGFIQFNKEMVAKPLEKLLNKPVKLARMNWQADSFHVYGKDRTAFEAFIKRAYFEEEFADRTMNLEDVKEMYDSAEQMVINKIADYDKSH